MNKEKNKKILDKLNQLTNKKKSLTIKLFYMNGGLILFVIFLSFILNNFYLGKYHISKKKSDMIKIANDLKKYSVGKEFYEISDRLSIENDVSLVLYKDYLNNGSIRMSRMHMGRGFVEDGLSERELTDIDFGKIVIKLFKNPMMNVNNLIAFVKLKDSEIVVIINSGLVINESTAIAREFYIMIAPFTLFLSLIASYFFTKRITKPIKKLNSIAKKMANMDFSEKFDLKTNDEIEELGKTFNYLSNQLEMNISNLNTVAEKLKKEISLEKELDKKRNEFISNVSHELKTPISLINAYSEGLKDGVASEEDKGYYYSTIIHEGNKMNKLINELMEYMKVKDHRSKLIYEEIEPIEIIQKTIDKFKLDFLEKNVNVELFFSEELNILIKISKLKFEQILDNLLSNAINHVDIGGNIKIITEDKSKKIKISIFNSGSTIPENSIKKVWEPFYKLDKARERKYGGIGLGLSIVKEIFEMYDFEYGIVSTEVGVEFYFYANT